MFIGRHYHTIEEKGRVSLPKSFREQEHSWVITRGLDGGLFLFPQQTFHEQIRQLSHKGFTRKADRDFVRLMTNDAQFIDADRLGRIPLPEYLRATAQLTKQVVFVGSYEHVELWDVTKYHTYIDTLAERAEEIAEQVGASPQG